MSLVVALVAPLLAQDDPRDRNAERAAAQAAPASVPVDLSGEWDPVYHEDYPERLPGPALGDYLGLPINESARHYAESWDAARMSLPEHQCMVHVAPYIMRGPGAFRMWQERDPDTQQLVAFKLFHGIFQQTRTIWMDGRPHPDEYAPHTWMGFSTGKWEGDVLTVYTTHLKQGWIRRNGTPESDRATLAEHFIRHGNILTHVGIVTDPAYLSEPLIRTQDFAYDINLQAIWTWPCDLADEVATRQKGAVPHYLPGENPNLAEFPAKTGIPAAAARGGAATMYPEYRRTPSASIERHSSPTAATIHGPADAKAADMRIRTRLIRGDIFMLTTAAGNTVVQAGAQGALLVDAQPELLSQAVLTEIERLSHKSIRYIINTDYHSEHTGGNERLRRAGSTLYSAAAGMVLGNAPDGATVIAHENVLNRMSAPTGQQSPAPAAAWPTITYFRDEKDLFFNGESIQIFHQPSAHTDGDSLVFFRRSDVIATGDLFSPLGYPVVDLSAGGTIQGVIDGLNRILDLAIPEFDDEGGTMIVPGRGRLCDEADVAEYRDMVTIVRDRVQALVDKGQTLTQVQAARPTLDYDPLYGATSGPWTTEMFVNAVYASLTRPAGTGRERQR